MEKDANFYFNNDFAFLSSSSLNENGLLYMTPPFIKAEWHKLQIRDKYALVNRVLEGSNDKEVYNKSISFESVIFKTYGFKSWGELKKKAKLCHISYNETVQEFIVTPTERDEHGYSWLSGYSVTIEGDTYITNLINTLEKCMLLCR